MATARETSYEGGVDVGGKLRRTSNRPNSKPYDRPPSWISNRLLNPASRLITQSAYKLFSIVIPKSLPVLPSTSEVKHESTDAITDQNQRIPYGDQERKVDEERKVNINSDSAINDLEQILKHKTFTRAEIDHLTELLRSKMSDVSDEDENRRFEMTTSQPVEAPDKMEKVPVQGEVKRNTPSGTASVSLSRPNFHDEDVASPTELAKAYMESRSSKGTPSTLHLHGQSFGQDVSRQTSVPFTPNSHALTVVQRTTIPNASAPTGPESGYLTPVPQGRSAIYSMARTPYSRVHPTAMLKGTGSMTNGKAGLLTTSQSSWKNNLLLSGGKQASKRRISVLDSDIGSIGPIRRTRQKTNMMFSSQSTGLSSASTSLHVPFAPISSDVATNSRSTQNQVQLQGLKHSPVRGIIENGESSSASRSACFSNQSRETAQKILQQLEKIAPSPKGKSRETTTVLETSPQFIPGIFNGQGIKSTEGVHSSKLIQKTQVNAVLDGLGDSTSISVRELRSQKQARFDEAGPSMISTSEDKVGPQAEGTVTKSTKDVIPSLRTATAVMSSSVANVTEKKQDSEEKANKDPVEHEQTKFSSVLHANSLVAGKGKHNRRVVEEIANGANTGSFASDPASEKNPLISATNEVAIPDPFSLSPPSMNKISTSNKTKTVRFCVDTDAVEKAAPVASGFSGVNGAQSESKEDKLEAVSSTREFSRSNNDQNVGGDLKHTVSSSKLASTHPGIFSIESSTNSSTSSGFPALSPSNGLLSSSEGTATATSTSISTTPVSQFGPSTSVSTALSNSVSIPPAAPWTSSTPLLQNSPMQFDSAPAVTTGVSASSSGSVFPFTSVATTSASPLTSFSGFDAENPNPSFGSEPTENEQMDTDNGTNEHTVPSSSQPPSSSPQPLSFEFGAQSLAGGPGMFQFSSQQDPTSQSPPLSFSLGTGGRRFIKVCRGKRRR